MVTWREHGPGPASELETCEYSVRWCGVATHSLSSTRTPLRRASMSVGVLERACAQISLALGARLIWASGIPQVSKFPTKPVAVQHFRVPILPSHDVNGAGQVITPESFFSRFHSACSLLLRLPFLVFTWSSPEHLCAPAPASASANPSASSALLTATSRPSNLNAACACARAFSQQQFQVPLGGLILGCVRSSVRVSTRGAPPPGHFYLRRAHRLPRLHLAGSATSRGRFLLGS